MLIAQSDEILSLPVSIGSVYQYFPDKRAIFIALHERHVSQIDGVIAATLIEHAASPLDVFNRAIVEAMIEAHTDDPELFELLQHEVSHRADSAQDFAVRLHGAFRLALFVTRSGIRKGPRP